MYLIFDKILINLNGVKYSLLLLVLSIVVYMIYTIYVKPSFVVPNRYKFRLLEIIYNFLIFGTVIVLILLPLNPQYILGKCVKKEKSLNIQFVLDVSLSMTAEDIKPYRFKAAKKTLIDLTESLKGFNISVIFFSGIPFVGIPFSDENYAVAERLKEIRLGDFPPTIDFVGTAIGDAILLGIANLNKFATNKQKPGIIILITDGDSNKGSDPIDAAKVAANYNIPIYVLGIGKSNYIVGKDYFGIDVPTKINIKLLEDISKVSGGKFYRILSNEDFKKFKSDLVNLIKTDEMVKIYYEKLNLTKYLLVCLVILLLIQLLYKIFILLNILKIGRLK